MSNKYFGATAINGGAAGAMDAIDGNLLSDGDICHVVTSTYAYEYHLNAASGAAESAPDIIAPDSNPGNKRWILVSLASTTIKGKVELATAAEMITGTDTSRVPSVSVIPGAIVAYTKHLRNIIYPIGIDYNDLYKAGWKPYWFNQQGTGYGWGGEYLNGSGTHAWFETGYIYSTSSFDIGQNVGVSHWCSQGFKVGQAIVLQAVWLKFGKAGNPQKDAEPFDVYIYDDTGGKPNTAIANGQVNAINGHDLTSSENWPVVGDTDGAWYRFTFSTNPSLSANTQYHIVIHTSGADNTNYFTIRADFVNMAYSHGVACYGDDATPSGWTAFGTRSIPFIIEATEATQFLQSGGQFHGKLIFNEGSPKNLGQFLCNDLKNMYSDEGDFTVHLTTSDAIPASSTLFEITMGDLGANRLRLYTDATPNVCVELYESDGTKASIIDGSTDVSGSANRTIMVRCRHKADGSDALELILNGTAEGTQLSSQTFSIDDNFADFATVILGGGFEAEPTWDKDFKTDQLAGGNLPSNDADTTFTTGTAATEASCYSVQNSVLYQNEAYYAIGNENGYYVIDLAGMADATGFALLTKQQIFKCVNTAGEAAMRNRINGDTNYNDVLLHEYYMETLDFKYQMDLMSKSNMIQLCAKNSDYFVFANGKLAIDGTGNFNDASGNTEMHFGDADDTAGSDADVACHEVLCYDAGPLFPSAADGFQVDEFAFWSADMTSIAALLYNSGSSVSVKELCGLDKNYVERIKQIEKRAVVVEDTNTGTAEVADSLEAFMLVPKSEIEIFLSAMVEQDTDQKYAAAYPVIDGTSYAGNAKGISYASLATGQIPISFNFSKRLLCGLHKIEAWWLSQDATSTMKIFSNIIIKEK